MCAYTGMDVYMSVQARVQTCTYAWTTGFKPTKRISEYLLVDAMPVLSTELQAHMSIQMPLHIAALISTRMFLHMRMHRCILTWKHVRIHMSIHMCKHMSIHMLSRKYIHMPCCCCRRRSDTHVYTLVYIHVLTRLYTCPCTSTHMSLHA